MSVGMGSALPRPQHTLHCALAKVWCSDCGRDSRLGCSGSRAPSLELANVAVPRIDATRAANPVLRGHRPAWIFMSGGALSPAPAALVLLAFDKQAVVGSNPTGDAPHNWGLFRHARGPRANFHACCGCEFLVTVCGWRALSESDARTGAAATAQLAARRSHNPTVVSSGRACRAFSKSWLMHAQKP